MSKRGVGEVQGAVSDSSGAVVPSASVALVNFQTDNKFQTTTSDCGLYLFGK